MPSFFLSGAITTIGDEVPWQKHERTPPSRRDKYTAVFVRIQYEETELRQRVKEACEHRDSERLLWMMPFNKAVDLGLKDRIIGDVG